MTLLWDWNGTLLDDTREAVAAMNEVLARRGLAPIDIELYRREFAFPVKPFYGKLGVDLSCEDWDALAREYHDALHARPASLARDAVEALGLAGAAGARQAIVSALRQDLLDAETARLGVRDCFFAVRGTDNLDGSSKLARAKELADEAVASGGGPLVMIGDSLHDLEVAGAVGARCVLYSGGSHSAERLRPFAPTGETLVEAVRLALAAAGRPAPPRVCSGLGGGGCGIIRP